MVQLAKQKGKALFTEEDVEFYQSVAVGRIESGITPATPEYTAWRTTEEGAKVEPIEPGFMGRDGEYEKWYNERKRQKAGGMQYSSTLGA